MRASTRQLQWSHSGRLPLWYRWTPQIEFQWRREVRNHVDAKQLEFALLCRTTAPLLPFIRALTKEGGVTDVSKPFAGFIR